MEDVKIKLLDERTVFVGIGKVEKFPAGTVMDELEFAQKFGWNLHDTILDFFFEHDERERAEGYESWERGIHYYIFKEAQNDLRRN